MKTTSNYVIIMLLGISLLCSCSKTILPDHPDTADEAIPKIEEPSSQINIDMSINLGKYFQKAEQAIPSEKSGEKKVCEGLSYSYYFKRLPLVLEGRGKTVTGRIEGKYKLQGAYCAKCILGNCIHPKISFSCGEEGEPLRSLKIAYSITMNVSQEYNLVSKTKLIELKADDQSCSLSALNIDITDQLIGQLNTPLNTLAAKVDETLGKVALREQVEKSWKTVTGGLKLGNYGYLYFNPQHVKLGSISLQDSILNFSVTTTAKPVITTDILPVKHFNLPELTDYVSSEKGFNAYVDLKASYDSLSSYLTHFLGGTTITLKRKKFIIVKASIHGMGNGKLIAAITFKGYKKGIIYLIGTPHFDKTTNEISIPDCDYDIKTKAVLLKLADWIYNDKIVNILREKTKFNLTSFLETSRKKIQKEMNRDVGEHAHVDAKLRQLNIEAVYPLKDKLVLRALAKGEFSVKLTP